jgi:arginase
VGPGLSRREPDEGAEPVGPGLSRREPDEGVEPGLSRREPVDGVEPVGPPASAGPGLLRRVPVGEEGAEPTGPGVDIA